MSPHSPGSGPYGRPVRAALAVAATVVALAACGSDDAAEPPPVEVDRAAVAAATVAIESGGCGPLTRFGRGTVVDDGLVLTAAHTVAGAETVDVVIGGRRTVGDVVFLDSDVDVAAVRIDAGTPAAVALSDVPVDGDLAAVVAFADDAGGGWDVRDVEVGDPLTIRTTDIYRGRDVERDGFKVAAEVDEGDSGSMVHQAGGGVGVIWARSNIEPDQAWAVAIPDLFLDAVARASLVDPVATGACP